MSNDHNQRRRTNPGASGESIHYHPPPGSQLATSSRKSSGLRSPTQEASSQKRGLSGLTLTSQRTSRRPSPSIVVLSSGSSRTSGRSSRSCLAARANTEHPPHTQPNTVSSQKKGFEMPKDVDLLIWSAMFDGRYAIKVTRTAPRRGELSVAECEKYSAANPSNSASTPSLVPTSTTWSRGMRLPSGSSKI